MNVLDALEAAMQFQLMNIRRFPAPWPIEELDACFVVRDANGQALGYFYFEEEPHRRSAAKLLIATRSGGSSQSMDVARAEVGIVYSVRKSRRSRSQCPGIVGMS